MRRNLWRHRDHQDVPLWRRMTALQVATAARASAAAVVPMTIIRRDVFDELTAGARAFVLTASRPTLELRIAGAEGAQQWRTDNLDRCLAAFDNHLLGHPVDTNGRTPADVAQQIVRQP